MTGQTARPLDEVDRAMLGVLCDDGRISMLELANRLGIPRVRTTYTTLILDQHPQQTVLPP